MQKQNGDCEEVPAVAVSLGAADLELEAEFQRQDAWSALSGECADVRIRVPERSRRGGDTVGRRSRRARCEGEAAVDAGELHVVQDVEGFQLELEFTPLPK